MNTGHGGPLRPVRSKTTGLVGLVALLLVSSRPSAHAQSPTPEGAIELREFLVIPRVGVYGRSPMHLDPIQAAMALGTWRPPAAATMLTSSSGASVVWRSQKADEAGWLKQPLLGGGYAYAEVKSADEQILLLEATGHAMVYVNGEPRAGDPYQTGNSLLPVKLRKGVNELLFHIARGNLKARLLPPPSAVSIDPRDATLPDLVAGEHGKRWIGVLVINAQDEPLTDGEISSVDSSSESLTAKIGSIPSLSTRKIPVPILNNSIAEGGVAKAYRVQLDLTEQRDGQREIVATAAFNLAVVSPESLQTRTFVSAIDSSVQSYSVLPAKNPQQTGDPGLVVSLHDLGEPARTHLAQQQPIDGAHLLAPEGRRPYGFDWESFSALDVVEAMDDAKKHFQFDSKRMWLVGEETGGHGVWHLGTRTPQRWAAIGPGSGWISYQTFGHGLPDWPEPTATQQMLLRGAGSVDTLALIGNLAPCGIYLHHNKGVGRVPLDQSQQMRRELANFHGDFVYREETRTSPIPALLADDGSLVHYLKNHTNPAGHDAVDRIDFATFDPSKSSRYHWLTISQQTRQLELSRVIIRYERSEQRFVGSTINVTALAIDVNPFSSATTFAVVLDGEAMGSLLRPPSSSERLWFVREATGWRPASPPIVNHKNPKRYGNFTNVFDHQVILIYGTQGNTKENAWSFAKARFDAEMLLSRANGSVEVIADREFQADRYADCNVVLFGNADTNSAWPRLLSTSPVQVRRGSVRLGMRPEVGDDLGCVFVWPRAGSDRAMIGVVSGTGLAGFRACDRLPYFVSGVVLPDLMLFGVETLRVGVDEVRAVGFFGPNWLLQTGDIAWRDTAL